MSTVTVSVPDISCGHCKEAIEGALAKVPGVVSAVVDVPSKTVAVDPGSAGMAAVTAAIVDAGYVVDPAPVG